MENLAIFFGGKSAEHDISIITAIQVINNIDLKKYNIIPIYINNKNEWYYVKNYKDLNNYLNENNLKTKLVNGFFESYLIKKNFLGLKKLYKIDVAINCLHGLNGEDGSLAGLLQLNNIPYVGSGILASSVGMDKVIMKDVFVANNIPCVKYISVNKCDFETNSEKFLEDINKKIGYPAIVKPANLGSSIGISIANNIRELIENLDIAFSFDNKIIVEEVVPNLREINLSLIGNYKNIETSVLEEPKNWIEFLDFNEKYILGNKSDNKKTIDVSINKDIDKKIKDYGKKIFKIFGCSGVVRIDFMLNNKTQEVFVNEINTIPGSYANYLWKKDYSFKQLLNKLIELSKEEYLCKSMYNYAYKSDVLKLFDKQNSSTKFSK